MENNILELIISIITGLGIIATFVFNLINLKKILKDNEPQLLFDLRNFHGELILTIKNTGKTKATDIRINIKKVRNNNGKILNEDFLFCIPFELSTDEQTQSKIADYGGTWNEKIFPYIDINVSYKKPHSKKEIIYERQVFFNPQTINEFDSLSDQLTSISEKIDKLQKPLLRLANYFDGCQIAPFDDLNIVAGKSLKKDISDVLINKKQKITSQKASIDK